MSKNNVDPEIQNIVVSIKNLSISVVKIIVPVLHGHRHRIGGINSYCEGERKTIKSNYTSYSSVTNRFN